MARSVRVWHCPDLLDHGFSLGASKLCSESGQWRDFCRHDVNGEIAVVNPELALEHCAAEEGDLLMRKSCWHGIGKYIARVDVQKTYAACDQVPPGPEQLYRGNAFMGLAGEHRRAEDETLSRAVSNLEQNEIRACLVLLTICAEWMWIKVCRCASSFNEPI